MYLSYKSSNIKLTWYKLSFILNILQILLASEMFTCFVKLWLIPVVSHGHIIGDAEQHKLAYIQLSLILKYSVFNVFSSNKTKYFISR